MIVTLLSINGYYCGSFLISIQKCSLSNVLLQSQSSISAVEPFNASVSNLKCHHFNTSSGFWNGKSGNEDAGGMDKKNEAKVWGLGFIFREP